MGAKLLGETVNGDLSYSEWKYEVTFKGGTRTKLQQVAARRWRAETIFLQSFNETLDQYRLLLMAHGNGTLRLPDQNFDIGEPTKPGAYRLADDAYAKLLDSLNGKPISAELRGNILAFYSNPNAPLATKQDDKAWKKLLGELDKLNGEEVGP